ncbi:hypothetical protein DFJ58DRAFT_916366 [Suillus subalutaceus]|uniref:uncharacterized protein n=1 Tax=Suillus subalutaceus TaxID=48586 RepID=UPI001B87EBB9|nr:uncharacterized protein DFJ58DRAFT_916366 [Suillus subalutaceus]KAG1841936.1 hypothetical protein DFJ58DRAFT_916366 [Suillus subalutaceus]
MDGQSGAHSSRRRQRSCAGGNSSGVSLSCLNADAMRGDGIIEDAHDDLYDNFFTVKLMRRVLHHVSSDYLSSSASCTRVLLRTYTSGLEAITVVRGTKNDKEVWGVEGSETLQDVALGAWGEQELEGASDRARTTGSAGGRTGKWETAVGRDGSTELARAQGRSLLDVWGNGEQQEDNGRVEKGLGWGCRGRDRREVVVDSDIQRRLSEAQVTRAVVWI